MTVNVHGPLLAEIGRKLLDVIETGYGQGLDAEIASHLLVVTGIDLYRANFGEEGARENIHQTVDLRFSRPPGYWGDPVPTAGGPAIISADDFGRPN